MQYSTLSDALSSARQYLPKFAAAVTATALLIGGNAHAVQIDDFNGGNVFPPITESDAPATSIYSGAVGGARTIRISGLGATLSVFNGVYTHDNSSSSASDSRISWQGIGGIGFQGADADFTDGGASDVIRVNLQILGSSPPELEFQIITGGRSQGNFVFTPDASGVYDVPLDPSAWDIPQTQPVLDFSDVGILDLFVRAGGADSVVIDNIATAAAVPPATGDQPPVADANGPYTGEPGVAVSFDGSASSDPDGTIQTYAWDFGDENTGSGVTLNHIYATAGIYNVTLTVTDDDGLSDSVSTQAIIGQGNQLPVADAGGHYAGQVGVAISFDGSASSDPDGTIETYAWNFDDGNAGTGATPTHTYGAAGLYRVTLTVTDNDGASDSDSTYAIIGVSDQPPVADANGPYLGTQGVAVSIDGSASSDPDGTIETYAWEFGDLTSGTGATPTHTYPAPGDFTVTLTVTDNEGLSDSNDTRAIIGVGNQPPVADADGPYWGDVDATISFDGNASDDPDGSIVSWAWRFGDGTTGTGPTPTHSYSEAGKYWVLLTVTDDQGVPDSTLSLADIGPFDLSGTVTDAAGTPLCALVLASGQFMFSCNQNGPYSLTDLPREADGTVKRQVYVDGFFPNVKTLTASFDETVVMTRANNCPDYNSFADPGTFPESAGKRIDVSGTVLLQNTDTPVCAMVLGNGQFGFTCDGTGTYAANIPLDANGQYKLQVYAQGFAPMVQVFDEFTATNVEVRLARATECQ